MTWAGARGMEISRANSTGRDHGGGLDRARETYGGAAESWIDLSTGINPVPYPVPEVSARSWTGLPDKDAEEGLVKVARAFWKVPEEASVLAVPGASAAIAALPRVLSGKTVEIPEPTYNEHRAGFEDAGWQVETGAKVRVLVHPNNPDGRMWSADDLDEGGVTVLDESFCDVTPEESHVGRTGGADLVVLKSFGKFWGLAGLRLGFVIAGEDLIAPLRARLGPWPVSGPALEVGAQALRAFDWAEGTRQRLAQDARRLDQVMEAKGHRVVGGCDLFRLYDVKNAKAMQEQLARGHVWSRIFPYSDRWLRLGIPAPADWDQLEAAL